MRTSFPARRALAWLAAGALALTAALPADTAGAQSPYLPTVLPVTPVQPTTTQPTTVQPTTTTTQPTTVQPQPSFGPGPSLGTCQGQAVWGRNYGDLVQIRRDGTDVRETPSPSARSVLQLNQFDRFTIQGVCLGANNDFWFYVFRQGQTWGWVPQDAVILIESASAANSFYPVVWPGTVLPYGPYGPLNPYTPYNPWTPTSPYNPYNPYNPLNPLNPYDPFNPYNPYVPGYVDPLNPFANPIQNPVVNPYVDPLYP
jgi:hypothetical protein